MVGHAGLNDNLVLIFGIHREPKIHLGDFFRMIGECIVRVLVLSKRNGKAILAFVFPSHGLGVNDFGGSAADDSLDSINFASLPLFISFGVLL